MSLPPNKIAHVEGYGMLSTADGYLFQPTCDDEIRAVFDLARNSGRKVVLRGAGRSYGDASIAPEQIVLDIRAMNRILAWDKEVGIIDVEAGATIENLWRKCLPDGWWPPVVSGTMFPTIAGALAMNIHGKNAFKVGNLGEHVLSIDVLLPDGSMRTLVGAPPSRPASESKLRSNLDSPHDEEPQFSTLISSAGLLGVIVRAKIQMQKVLSGDLTVVPISCRNWDDQFAAFEANEATSDYMVSWVDAFARGTKLGRGLVHVANYAEGSPETLTGDHQDLPSKILGLFPKSKVWKILRFFNRRGGMKLLNALKHTSAKWVGNRKPHRQSLVAFSFLLDYVPDWRFAYKPGGFIQYQSIVPKEHAKEVFSKQLEMAQAERLEPLLAVFKRHRPDGPPFLFGHSLDGYSLALDFKVTEKSWLHVEALCHRMNDLVLDTGGRFYFAKDSTLRPQDVEAFLGEERLHRYRNAKTRCDPEGLLTSALAERVGLVQKDAS